MDTDYIGHYSRTRKIAQCFAQTAALLYAKCLNETPRQEPLLIVPFVVNASFACELFLKALAYRGQVCLKGHQLSTLFATLPNQERERLEQAWTAVAQRVECEPGLTLASAISELSNSFVEWRYTHEKERVSTASSAAIHLLLEVLEAASHYCGGDVERPLA
jgi:hypothetical protein